ncbi:MAG: nucleotidyltransferase domain-containing protein [Pseudoxanthomonas sp.]
MREVIDFAFLYGSVARNADHAASDIDILVISDRVGLADLYAALEPVEHMLGRTVKPTIYTLDQVRARLAEGQSFMTRVMALPKQWLVGDEVKMQQALAREEAP